MKKQTLFWILSIVITIAAVFYQRLTGPTYSADYSLQMEGEKLDISLPRSHGGESDCKVEIEAPDKGIEGTLSYRRYPTLEEWTKTEMKREGDNLTGSLPNQPPAGKLEYSVVLKKSGKEIRVNTNPVVIRFKGAVPAAVLIIHILFIFVAMIFSNVAGIFAATKLPGAKLYGTLTVVFLFIGGFVMGPIVQKYAFGAYWTGFPFGEDLTDNKVLLAMVVWLIALAINFRKEKRVFLWIAAVVYFLINMIPHSMLGSELDPETGEVITGMITIF